MKRRNSYYTEINPRSKFVYCRDCGGSYTTYDELFDAYPKITKYKDRYAHKSLTNGVVYKVITEVPLYKGEIPYCEYTESACTLCVFGNKETYNKAIKNKEDNNT